jgi:DNA-directed RNA polymerase specialized sigma24 family protein
MPAVDPYVFANPFLAVTSLDALLGTTIDGDESDLSFEVTDPCPTPEDTALTDCVSSACRGFLNKLTPAQREVVTKIFWEGQRQADVARSLGVSRSAVKQRLDKALAFGREALASHQGYLQAY